MGSHIAKSANERVVIIGGGFGGLEIARRLRNAKYQVVIVDKNNYHQFQPLFYQVATSWFRTKFNYFPVSQELSADEKLSFSPGNGKFD